MHVLKRCKFRKKVMELVNKPHLPIPDLASFRFFSQVKVLTIKEDGPRSWRISP